MALISAVASDRSCLARILAQSKWSLKVRMSCRDGMALLREHHVPVVICDAGLRGGGWHSLLEELADWPAPPALIVSSRLADEQLWAEVLNLGGYDVLPTPFEQTEVLRVCYQAWKSWERRFGMPRLAAAG
jgi:DNA-binding response OmpR family regulator